MSELKNLIKLHGDIEKAIQRYETAYSEYVEKRAMFKKGEDVIYNGAVYGIFSIEVDCDTEKLVYKINQRLDWGITFEDGSDAYSPIGQEVGEEDLIKIDL